VILAEESSATDAVIARTEWSHKTGQISPAISLGDGAGRPLRDIKLSLIDALNRSRLIRSAKPTSGASS